jgi:glycogen synthase
MFIFETSWEVCNKYGGIYTVISSKASYMIDNLKDNYILIGPYFMDKARGEFEPLTPPEKLRPHFEALQKEGINCHWGKWLIKGEPNVILIDFNGYRHHLNNIKKQLWEKFGIDSLNAPSDYDDPVLWSWCVGKLLSHIQSIYKNEKIVLHAHEWLSAPSLLYLKSRDTVIKKVFTTHATFLGRSLAGSNYPIYEHIQDINADQKAAEIGITAKHLTEKAACLNCDLMTTVSEITSLEVEHFLGRKPDILLPNGLDIDHNLTFEDISVSHRLQRDRMREFLLYYFFPYYSFDIRQSLFYFISGRYEFHNKGIDLFIDALKNLNEKLKKDSKSKTIIAFFWVPANVSSIKPVIREAREIFANVEQTLDETHVTTESNILYNLMAGNKITADLLFEKDTLRELKRKLLRLKAPGDFPSICTYNLVNEKQDSMLNKIKEKGLLNRPEDKVKIIVYPTYLTGSDGLLNLSYKECIQGAHLGVFPSYYEPWGYTPLETASLGVVSVTTDLAGFGRFVKPNLKNKKYPGIFVIDRYQKSYQTAINSLANVLHKYASFSYYERVQNKIGASNLSLNASWSKLIKHYIKAYKKVIS